jgi:hypothetical protein
MKSTHHPASILHTRHTLLPLLNLAWTQGQGPDHRHGWKEQGEPAEIWIVEGRIWSPTNDWAKASCTNDAITYIHSKARIRRVLPDFYPSLRRCHPIASQCIRLRPSGAPSKEQVRNPDVKRQTFQLHADRRPIVMEDMKSECGNSLRLLGLAVLVSAIGGLSILRPSLNW